MLVDFYGFYLEHWRRPLVVAVRDGLIMGRWQRWKIVADIPCSVTVFWVSKSCRHRHHWRGNILDIWGIFGTSGEHFGTKFTLFCSMCSFVANHSPLTLQSWNFITRTNKLNSTVVQKHKKKVPWLPWFKYLVHKHIFFYKKLKRNLFMVFCCKFFKCQIYAFWGTFFTLKFWRGNGQSLLETLTVL